MNASNRLPVRVKRVSSQDVRALRHRVLWPHKASPDVCVIDLDDAPHAIHLAAFANQNLPWGLAAHGQQGSLVGACSLFDQPCERLAVPGRDGQSMRLRVMGTLPEARGWGAGAALIARAAEEVRSLGKEVLWCDAREVAFGFYQRMGFVFLNDTYDIPDIGPHRTMALDLSSRAH